MYYQGRYIYLYRFFYFTAHRAKRRTAVNKRLRLNHQIRVPEVRLIDDDGKQLGLKTTSEALVLAQEKSKDLVEISPTANPPVCKIIDYSKYRYEQEKKFREAKKKQKNVQLKEMRFRPRIGGHDLEVKIKRLREFLEEGHKVKISIMFFGREMKHHDLGKLLVEKIKTSLLEYSEVEQNARMFGNRLILVLSPKK